MFKRLQLLSSATLFIALLANAQQIPYPYTSVSKVNYVRTWDVKVPYTNPASVTANTLPAEVLQTTQYIDGFGRPIQTVVKQGSPSSKDIVIASIYDPMGRESLKFLPFVSSNAIVQDITNDGKFKLDAFQQQDKFFDTELAGQGQSYYYSQTNYEASSLNKVLKVLPEGNSWVGSNRGVSSRYETNVLNEVRLFTIADAIGSSPGSTKFYDAGKLYRNVTTDEHGKRVVEYIDQEGKILLKKVEYKTASTAVVSSHTDWLCTYYIYDKKSLLRAVIQPRGVELLIGASWLFSPDVLNEQMFRYDYDDLKRMITKKVPGAGLVEMVYDLRDRLIMTREARFAVTGNTFWNVTKYDNLNRVVKIGLISNASTRATHQAAADASTDFSYPVVAATEVMQENYYDNYSWVNTQPAIAATMYTGDITSSFFYTSPSSFNVAPQYPQQILADYANVRGLPTGSKVRVLGTTTYLYSVTFYDDDKRVIQVRHGNISGSSGYDHITTQYDFSGKPLRVMHRHEKAGAMARYIRELTKYTYDHADRPLTTTKKIGTSGADIVVSQKSYNERGQLKSNIVGNALETQDYEYNIRNWSVGLNRQWLKNLNTRYFGYELAYDNAPTSIAGQSYTNPEYNGNIGGLIWKSGGDKEVRKYDFTYDAANRLLNANFNQYDVGTSTFQNAAFNFTTTIGNGTDPTTAYDANGNILSLTQKGWKLNSSPTIDQLTYTYQTGSNKLTKVADSIPYTSSQLGDFKDGVNTGDDYSYDLSGNLTLDNNKLISSILYTHQNMPYEINVTGKGKITYAYDNNGTKWKKTIVDNVSGKTTIWLYMDNFVYKDDTLQFFSFEEGRARYDATQGTPEATKFDFDYFLKDHLGNVRMVLTAEKDTIAYPSATIETATRAKRSLHP